MVNIFLVDEVDKQSKSSSIIRSEEQNKKANDDEIVDETADETVEETVDEGLIAIYLFVSFSLFIDLFINEKLS